MSKKLNVSPIIIIKQKDGTTNSAIVVDNGPMLMDENKKYTAIFDDLLEKFPDILTATFYNKKRTSYRITVQGCNESIINGIKEYFEPSYVEYEEEG